jgi:ABC-type glycerol-3-phosphate transport system substrate-binding protein
VYATADPFDGLDPFHEEHYTDKAAEQYTKPNPLRDTGEGFPKNVPIFAPDKEYPGGRSAFEQAKQHLAAGQANLENGFPQPNWPGASQYVEDLSIHIQRALTGEESPQAALDNAAEKWRTTRDELGRENQKKVYNREFLSKAEEFGYV